MRPSPLRALLMVGALLVAGAGGLVVRERGARPPLAALEGVRLQVGGDGLLRLSGTVAARRPVQVGAPEVEGTGVVVVSPLGDGPALAVLRPGCTADGGAPAEARLVVPVSAGDERQELRTDLPGLQAAVDRACAPVRATVAPLELVPARTLGLRLDVRVRGGTGEVVLLGLGGAGLVARPGGGQEFPLRLGGSPPRPGGEGGGGTGRVSVLLELITVDCAVEALAPRRLVLTLRRGGVEQDVVADNEDLVDEAVDDLVRTTCRRRLN